MSINFIIPQDQKILLNKKIRWDQTGTVVKSNYSGLSDHGPSRSGVLQFI